MAGISSGPTPWWELPEYQGKRSQLEQSAPPGYEYDPVQMQYVRTPTAQGAAVKEYNDAANPALAGLLASISGGGGLTGGAGSFGGGTSSGGFTSGGGSVNPAGGITAGSRLPTLQMPDQSAASRAAFATAKDRVGQTGRASLDALRGELGASGMLGGGAEGQLVRDTVTKASGELGQVSRDQASKEADLAADFAKTNYTGGIAQRGQDVQAAEAQARLAQEQRLADATLNFQKQQAASQQQLSMLQLALSGLKGGGAAGGGLVY